MRCPHCASEIDESAVMSEAGRIAVRRRKNHKGFPAKVRPCRWCGAAVAGIQALDAHERGCRQRPSGDGLRELTESDLVPWTPDAA